MAKGRQIGQTKKMCKILDEVFGPYEIHMEENQFVLIDTKNQNRSNSKFLKNDNLLS